MMPLLSASQSAINLATLEDEDTLRKLWSTATSTGTYENTSYGTMKRCTQLWDCHHNLRPARLVMPEYTDRSGEHGTTELTARA